MDNLTIEEKRARAEAALERMYRKQGDMRTMDEIMKESEKMFYYTPESADELIDDIRNNRVFVRIENDEGPVFKTKEELIEDIKRCTKR